MKLLRSAVLAASFLFPTIAGAAEPTHNKIDTGIVCTTGTQCAYICPSGEVLKIDASPALHHALYMVFFGFVDPEDFVKFIEADNQKNGAMARKFVTVCLSKPI